MCVFRRAPCTGSLPPMNTPAETAKPVGIKEEDKVTQVQAVATVSGSSSGARRRARSTPLPPSAPKPAQTGRVPKHARDAAEGECSLAPHVRLHVWKPLPIEAFLRY